MDKKKLILALILISTSFFPESARTQVLEYLLEVKSTPDNIGKDRKDFNPDPSIASESYQYNFDIPDSHPDDIECTSLVGIEFEINTLNQDNNILSGCFINYFSHLLTCDDFGVFACPSSDVIWESGFGSSVNSFFEITDESDLDYVLGTTIGFDIVPVIDAFNPACNLCSITSGDFDGTYEITVTLIYAYDIPEDVIDLDDTEEYCDEPGANYEYKGPNNFELYEWRDSNGYLISSSSRRDFEVPSPGEYTLTVTDDNGCTQEQAIEFTAIPAPLIEFTMANPLISCGSLSDTIYTIVDGITSNPDYNFSWETPSGNRFNQSQLVLADTGTYILEVSSTSLSCDFFNSFRYTTIDNSPARITSLDSMDLTQVTLCDGETIELTAFVPYQDQNIYSYEWIYGLDTLRTKDVSFSSSGRYYLNMQDNLGCPPTRDTFDLNVAQPLSAGDDNSIEACPVSNYDLTAQLVNNSSSSGRWTVVSNNAVVSNPSNLDVQALSGLIDYYYIVDNPSPCLSDTALISISFPAIAACDDGNPCTNNDLGVSLSDGSICIPCSGTIIDCSNGSTTTRSCDDLDPNTIDDMETILDCDGSVCMPCSGEPADCSTGNPQLQACNDNNPCTENDMESVLPDGTICMQCTGIPLDCSNGMTSTQICDDLDPNTVNDMETILDCDGSICVPCAGETADCNTGNPIAQPCDDINPCTTDDIESVLADGTVCVPCEGIAIDCSNGMATTQPCDDMDPNTVNDIITTLDCDGTICIPCAGEPADCSTGMLILQACDDNNPCTDNDMESVLADGTVCAPCEGVTIDCTNGMTTMQICDDLDPNTVNDMETILDCDGSVCVPCQGEAADCANGNPIMQACDDDNPCTENDTESVLADGTVCLPCEGIALDCSTGMTTTLPCDDLDPNTVNDLVTTLDCDDSICIPCAGEPADCTTGNLIVESCDDNNPCSENDMETVLADGTVCVPCEGIIIDCSNGLQTTQPCDDFDASTINDMETILDCDGSICIPCAGQTADCITGNPTFQACNDNNPCTENDMESVLADGTICEPCLGQELDCTNSPTSIQPCDDLDPNTVNDIETILDCDGSICIPCAGQNGDCNTLLPQEQACDDGDDCTSNDIESVLEDGTICEPCLGQTIDCNNGPTTTRNCDDGDETTINDFETILDCDESICVPCSGTKKTVKIYLPNIISKDESGNNTFQILSSEEVTIIDFRIYDRWGNVVHNVANTLSSDPRLSWNGTVNDKNVVQGVYIFRIEYESSEESIIEFGEITVLN